MDRCAVCECCGWFLDGKDVDFSFAEIGDDGAALVTFLSIPCA